LLNGASIVVMPTHQQTHAGHIRAALMTGRKFWNILKFNRYCVILIPVPAAGKTGLFFRGFDDRAIIRNRHKPVRYTRTRAKHACSSTP
jgi:hypothetical protein